MKKLLGDCCIIGLGYLTLFEITRIILEKTTGQILIKEELAASIYFGQIHANNKRSNAIKIIRQ